MVMPPGVWEESPLWEQRGDTTIYHGKVIIDTLPVEMPAYYFDPLGRWHRPDGVWEAVVDSECVEWNNPREWFIIDTGGGFTARGYTPPVCLKWQTTNTLVWKKMEDE